MARLAIGALFGIVVGVLGGAALGIKASDESVDQTELEAAATEAGVDAQDLLGAVNSTGLPPRSYLAAVGELPSAPAPRPQDNVDKLLSCLARFESGGDPGAYNHRSGASGLLQFLPSTWKSTPQGAAGMSIWDASAQLAAGRWMIQQGRLREWSTRGFCA